MSSMMYVEFATEYDIAVKDNAYNANLERPSLISLLPGLSGKKVLDLGCGSGVYARYLHEEGAKVTSVDASEEMIAITKEKLGNNVEAYVQDLALGLPREKSESYDVVICPLTIHYIEVLYTLFCDVNRVMKKGGLFIFSTHHPLVDSKASVSGNYYCTEKIIENWHTLARIFHPLMDFRRCYKCAKWKKGRKAL